MSHIELSHPRRQTRERAPSFLLRLRVLTQRGRLDRMIADGRSPASDPRLAVRAAQLTRPATRSTLAASLRRVLDSIDERPRTRFQSPEIPVDAPAVRACGRELDDLARALITARPRARGVAITRLLITDGRGPLYMKGDLDRLRNTLLSARAAL